MRENTTAWLESLCLGLVIALNDMRENVPYQYMKIGLCVHIMESCANVAEHGINLAYCRTVWLAG